MIIKQEEKETYAPVTIILETKEEFKVLYNIANTSNVNREEINVLIKENIKERDLTTEQEMSKVLDNIFRGLYPIKEEMER